jgi:hypothetical protein
MDYNAFVAKYPHFINAPQSLVQAHLDDATALCPLGVWGGLQGQGIGLRAARALALSPYARNLSLASAEGKTVYDDQLKELIRIVAVGGLVA